MIAKKRGKTKVSVSAKGMKKAVIKITVKNISNKTKTNKSFGTSGEAECIKFECAFADKSTFE